MDSHSRTAFKLVTLMLLTLVMCSGVAVSLQSSFHSQIKKNISQKSENKAQGEIFLSFCRFNDEACCERTYINIKKNWIHGKLLLTHFMENLKRANCSRFEYECQQRTLSFTKFTSLVYSRFCEYESFRNTCKNEIATMKDYFAEDNNKPNACQQVMMYNSSRNDYLEIITYYSPFCGLVWCGFDVSTAQALKVSTWTCLESSCQVNIVVLMVICGILALITVVVNSTVLCVLWSYKNMTQSSQNLYRFSLATADLLVGLVVFPSFVSSLYYRLVAQREIMFTKSKNNLNGEHAVFANSFSESYLSAIGVFTTLSLTVSILTLVLAGFDRLKAIRDSIRYDGYKAAIRAKWLLILVWILGFVIAILPLFTPGLYPYSLIVGLLVATREEDALYEYLIGFGVPLLAVWISIGAIYFTVKKQGKIALKLSANSKATAKKERKVYKTLFLMLSAFTLSLAPSIIALFAQGDPRIHEELTDVYDSKLAAAWSSFELFAVLLLMCNSLWNFFIYSYREVKFRRMAAYKYKAISNLCFGERQFDANSPMKNSVGNRSSSVFVLEYRKKLMLDLKNESKFKSRARIPSNFSSQSDY